MRRPGAWLILFLLACGKPDAEPPVVVFEPGPTPPQLARGDSLYVAQCAFCHGINGTGNEKGPPLVHRTYEPSHHADEAFRRAVAQGVMAHHWSFGSMPPVPTVSGAEVEEIIRYVRWLQRQAGIH